MTIQALNSLPQRFAIPTELSCKTLLAELRQKLNLQAEPEQAFGRVFYDSFDWRLYAAGYLSYIDHHGSEYWLHLYALKKDLNAGHHRLRLDQPVRFARDLPEAVLKRQLEPLLEMRTLLPQAQLQCHQQQLKQLNRDNKTVLRLWLERSELQGQDIQQPLSAVLALQPLRGYEKACAKTTLLLHELELSPATENKLTEALAATGQQPLDYTSKLNLTLTADWQASTACRLILKTLWQTMQVNEPGTRQDLDSEFLHDFRVAIRRTRSVLSQLKSALPAVVSETFAPAFAELGQITGPTRDLDVYLLDFDDYKSVLPESMQADLEPMREYLQDQQQKAHRKLVRYLNSEPYKVLVADWERCLAAPLDDDTTEPEGRLSVLTLASQRIRKVYRRVLKQGQAIDDNSPADHLHDLRKTCKKLRYLMEFFQSVYPPKAMKSLISSLKGLQDNLGRHQDFEIQADTVRIFARDMTHMGASVETILAMGVLVQDLDRRRQQARDEFAERFGRFDTPGLRHRFEVVLQHGS